MSEHPIQGLMTTAMKSIKDMVDVNTIVGDAVQAPDGTVIIPISRVSFGFAAGGGEYNNCCGVETVKDDEEENVGKEGGNPYPFAGGSGAGVSINPVGFMVVGQNQIKLLPVDVNTSVDKVLDIIPNLINQANEAIKKKIEDKKESKKDSKKDSNSDTKNDSGNNDKNNGKSEEKMGFNKVTVVTAEKED